jgi:DNA-binding response OmpR family regulator/predicted regulator of Ras-like GTPase activity (Roadblock/LC7/MglB family)
MSELWRILLVEDDDNLNQSIVNSLRKDGYLVQGVRSGAEAIRIVWSEEYDVVIGDLKMPGADGFELLQWLRTYRPKTRMMMVAPFGSASTRTQALEAGVVSYLEKPLDLHLLKEELRRLLQQTGFSASLDSFDLLDVIQIITMSRKSIALLVNTGLEERGILRFQGGELIWAEYGMLRGEEAFFALAAHKNGTVTHQLWNEQIIPNVKQPLSRLIFQALQYRSKYADSSSVQQPTGEQEALARAMLSASKGSRTAGNVDPLGGGGNDNTDALAGSSSVMSAGEGNRGVTLLHPLPAGNAGTLGGGDKEWWQQSGKVPAFSNNNHTASSNSGSLQSLTADASEAPMAGGQSEAHETNIVPSTVRKTSASQRSDLPSWLTDQPTKSDMPMLRPSSLTGTAQVPATNRASGSASGAKPPPAEWQPTPPQAKTTEQLPRKQPTGAQKAISKGSNPAVQHSSSPEWLPPEKPKSMYGSLQSTSTPRKTSDALSLREKEESDSQALSNTGKVGLQRSSKRNYGALVAALQTLGYSIPGFIAAAVVSLDGQPIAQVAIDDLDISPMCGYFSTILQGVLMSLGHEGWGEHEDTVITSVDRHILLRLIGSDKEAFQVLITTRESDPIESLEVMANVEGALGAALR